MILLKKIFQSGFYPNSNDFNSSGNTNLYPTVPTNFSHLSMVDDNSSGGLPTIQLNGAMIALFVVIGVVVLGSISGMFYLIRKQKITNQPSHDFMINQSLLNMN